MGQLNLRRNRDSITVSLESQRSSELTWNKEAQGEQQMIPEDSGRLHRNLKSVGFKAASVFHVLRATEIPRGEQERLRSSRTQVERNLA